jgi:hypothetical protein
VQDIHSCLESWVDFASTEIAKLKPLAFPLQCLFRVNYGAIAQTSNNSESLDCRTVDMISKE